MPAFDFSHLSRQERLDPDNVRVTAEQKAELRRRRATLDADIANGRDAADVLADLRRR
jgi:hypothetical protein